MRFCADLFLIHFNILHNKTQRPGVMNTSLLSLTSFKMSKIYLKLTLTDAQNVMCQKIMHGKGGTIKKPRQCSKLTSHGASVKSLQ